jgi:hypothetical protein
MERDATEVVLLHGGALGDLALTIRLCVSTHAVRRRGSLRVTSRADPGDLSRCNPSVVRRSIEGLGAHWLYVCDEAPPPPSLREALAGCTIISALDDARSVVQARLATLGAARVYSFDPRPRADWTRHIVEQWERELAAQGVSFVTCSAERRDARALHAPPTMRARGAALISGWYGRLARRPNERDARTTHVAAIAANHTRTRTDADRASDAEPGPSAGGPILIHPGSGSERKNWPLSRFVETAQSLRAGGRNVCFLLGEVELERWPADRRASIAAEFPVVESPTADELAAMLSASACLLSNDAGPGHVAALLGTPTVALFGPTAAAMWRPLGPDSEAIQGDASAGEDWGVSPAQVVEAVVRRISGK